MRCGPPHAARSTAGRTRASALARPPSSILQWAGGARGPRHARGGRLLAPVKLRGVVHAGVRDAGGVQWGYGASSSYRQPGCADTVPDSPVCALPPFAAWTPRPRLPADTTPNIAAVALGLLCTVVILSFSERIFAFYTDEKDVLAALAPTPVAMAVQVSCNLVTTVVAGVVVASQEFRLQSIVYGSRLLLVFTPIVLFVANDQKIEMSIAWLLWANAAYQCWLCARQVYIATVYVPRKLRRQGVQRDEQAAERGRRDGKRLHAALLAGVSIGSE